MTPPAEPWPDRVEDWVQLACLWEATARKVGNVHPAAGFADTTYMDFVVSGLAAARAFRQVLSAPNPSVGQLVLAAITATKARVRANANLGIVLLLAPLALAPPGGDLPGDVCDVSDGLTVKDAADVYIAIRLATPGGLGTASQQDVRDEPTVTLLEAMRLAADRDAVARQYATGFADVLGTAAALSDAHTRHGSVEAAIVHCQLALLAAAPDTLIVRKCGQAAAADVQRRAAGVLALGLDTPAGRAAGVALDRHLRSDGNRLNPGATADLVTAALFAALRAGALDPAAPFPWPVTDWL